MTNVEMTSTGLTEGEAAHRLQARGRLLRRRSSRSYASILRANTFTVPNGSCSCLVELKVLSGDAPATAGSIARDAGVPGSAWALDGEALPTDPAALRDAVLAAPAVGRISPEGKRTVIAALTDAGRYVAMLGDVVPFLRSFYELSTLSADELAAWAVGTTVGIGGMLASLRLSRV